MTDHVPPLPPTCQSAETWVDTWSEQRADGRPDPAYGVGDRVSALLTLIGFVIVVGAAVWIAWLYGVY